MPRIEASMNGFASTGKVETRGFSQWSHWFKLVVDESGEGGNGVVTRDAASDRGAREAASNPTQSDVSDLPWSDDPRGAGMLSPPRLVGGDAGSFSMLLGICFPGSRSADAACVV